jgi:NitT/TauT family transport system permease protein
MRIGEISSDAQRRYSPAQRINQRSPNHIYRKTAIAKRCQLLRHVYLPSATSWVFSSLHTSVGLAFVGAVVGEYLGSSQGVGYLILQAEGTFDINTVMAGILVLTAFALVLDALVGRVERRLLTWQPKAGETEKL